MKFSILVPVYNVEKYLEQCVESLLNQTYNGEYEIILVDDGSTDSSGRICDKYADNYPQKIKVVHKKNEGLVSARQAGIAVATGEYSLFVDSDDFVETPLLEMVFSTLVDETETDILIYSFNYFKNGAKIKRKHFLSESKTVYLDDSKKYIYETLISTSLITSLWTKVVKTSILKNDPTDYSLYFDKNMAEDFFRSLNLLTAANKIVYINVPLYNYRINDDSISRSYRLETIPQKNTLYVYDRFLELLPIWEMSDEKYIQKLDARWLNETIYTFTQYYKNAPDLKTKKSIVDFNWDSMLPDSAKNNPNNPYENKINRKIFTWIVLKKYLRIEIYFTQKKIYKDLRNLKNRLRQK